MHRLIFILLLEGCSLVNSYPNEYGIETKQDMSPVRVPGYIPGVGKAKAQEPGLLARILTIPYRRAKTHGYTPTED